MTESDTVVVHVQLKPEDCIALQRATARILRPIWLEWTRAGAWLFYYFMVAVVPIWLVGMDGRSMGIFLLCSLIGLMPLVFLLRHVPDVDWSGSSALHPTDLTVSSAGVSFKSDVVDLKYDWRAFRGIEETPTHFFLYTDKLIACIVPKRVFGNPEDVGRFGSLLRAHIKTAA